jgi:hypothetical protein
LHILLARDGFAKGQPVSFDDVLTTIRFTLENRAAARHDTVVLVAGLPAGEYEARADSHPAQRLRVHNGEEQQIPVPVDVSGVAVVITRVGASTHR